MKENLARQQQDAEDDVRTKKERLIRKLQSLRTTLDKHAHRQCKHLADVQQLLREATKQTQDDDGASLCGILQGHAEPVRASRGTLTTAEPLYPYRESLALHQTTHHMQQSLHTPADFRYAGALHHVGARSEQS